MNTNLFMIVATAAQKGADAVQAAPAAEPLSDGAWLMFSFGCMFLYGGLIFGVVRAIRGKPPYPAHVLEKAADVGWLVALGLLAAVWYLAAQVDPKRETFHIMAWIGLYVLICVPLSVLARHLVIVHHKLTGQREEIPPETGMGGTTE